MEIACKGNGDHANGLIMDDTLSTPSTSFSTSDVNEDVPRSDASTVCLQIEEMEEEEEQYFDVSDRFIDHRSSNNFSKNPDSPDHSMPGPSGIKSHVNNTSSPHNKNVTFDGDNLDDVSTEAESYASDEGTDKEVFRIDSDSDDSLKNGLSEIAHESADRKPISLKLGGDENEIEEVILDSEKDVKDVEILSNNRVADTGIQKEVIIAEIIADDEENNVNKIAIDTVVLDDESVPFDVPGVHHNSANISSQLKTNPNQITVEVQIEYTDPTECESSGTEITEQESNRDVVGSLDPESKIPIDDAESNETVKGEDEKGNHDGQDATSIAQDVPDPSTSDDLTNKINESLEVNDVHNQPSNSKEKLDEDSADQSHSVEVNNDENTENPTSINGVAPCPSKSKNVLKELNCDPLDIKDRQEEEKKFAMCCPCMVVLPLLHLDELPVVVCSSSPRTRKRSQPILSPERPRSRRTEANLVCNKTIRETSDIFFETEQFSLPTIRLTRISSSVQLSNTKLPTKYDRASKKRLLTVESTQTQPPTKIQKFYKSSKKCNASNSDLKSPSRATQSRGNSNRTHRLKVK